MREEKKTRERDRAVGGRKAEHCGGETKAFDAESVSEAVKGLPRTGRKAIRSDVLGSYTGTDEDLGSPVQDADDL